MCRNPVDESDDRLECQDEIPKPRNPESTGLLWKSGRKWTRKTMKYRLVFLVLISISIAYSTQYRTDPRKGSKDSTSRSDLHFRAKKIKTDSLVASDVDLKAHSFAKEIHDMYARAPIKANRENKWTLKCDPGATDIYQISDKITAEPTPITAYDFFPAEVCVYDYLNKCRTKQHMSVASNISSICNFKLKDMIISSKGTIMESNSFQEIYFGDTTMVGGKAPEYAPVMAYMYLKGFEVGHAEFFEKRAISRTISNLVVPLRSRFDDCFNHQSFQTLPLIGLIFEFHSDIFHSISWHASRHTAALLMLLNITSDKIIIEESIRTEQILLPWIPYWNPIQLSPIYGISRRVCSEMTQGLLRKSFPKTLLESIHPIKVMNYKYEVLPEDQLLASAKQRRFIVYLHRSEGKRHVLNEPDILQAIHHSLHPDYQLIVLSSTRAYDEIEKMHVVWQQYAKIIVRAKVLIGPHGKHSPSFHLLIFN